MEEKSLNDYLSERHPNIDFHLSESKKSERPSILSKVVVDKKERNEGAGTKFMEDLISEADRRKHKLALTPSSDFGGQVPRLHRFYQRFGFVPNKGKHKDFSISEAMYRNPIERPEND
jgi:predicted GNAT family N-acyltransferase